MLIECEDSQQQAIGRLTMLLMWHISQLGLGSSAALLSCVPRSISSRVGSLPYPDLCLSALPAEAVRLSGGVSCGLVCVTL